jgi:hypothetical protein
MTAELLELLRNLYGASGGAVHGSAVSSAIFGAIWNTAWDDAGAAFDAARNSGASDEDAGLAFRNTFAESMGWSSGEMDEFCKHYDFTAKDAERFNDASDAFDAMIEHMRRGRGSK